MNPQGAATAEPAELLRLAYRCTRQVSFSWTPGDGRLRFGDEVAEFLAPGLLNDVRTGEDLVQRVNPADRKQLNDALVRALKGARDGDSRAAGIQEALFRLRSIDDRWHWIAMRGIVTATASDGRGARISGVLIDETERETERREAVRMRNLYAMQSAINRAISHCAERHALLTQVCEVAVAHGDFALAWVGLNGLRSQTVEVFTQAGGSTDYPARIAAVLRSGEMQQSRLIDRAMQACAPVIHNDLTALQPAPEWLPHALEAGFRSVGCLPLFEEGEPIGGLTLYSTEVDHFDADMVTLLQGMGSDVSHALGHLLIKRQQTEANRQLSEANRQLQTAMAASLDGMLVVAGDGSIVEMNPAARDLLGCGNEPQAGDSELLPAERNLFSTFTPLRLRAARKAQVRRLLKPEAASTMATLRRIETHLCRRDGFEVPAELVLTPLEPGENGLLMVTVRDLTALHRQRDQLIDAARRNEQLIEHSPDSVLVHIDETILLVNSKLRQLLGARNAQQLIGSHLRNIVHPADAQRLRARKHADGTDWLADQAIEIRLLRLDGAEIEVDLLAGDTEFQGQRARQVVLRDIGERKRLERMQHSQQAVLALIAARQPLATVLREVARAVERNAPGVRCAVFVAAENGQAFVSAFSSSDQMADPLQTEDLRQFAADSPSAICRAASLRAPVFVEDAQHDGSTARVRAVRRALGAKAAGAWPLLSLAGELMGVIYLTLPHTGQPGQQVLQLIAQYTDLTAVAIDNDRQAARIRHLAQHDVLTSLPNRATFKDLLDHAIDRSQRRGSLLAAMFVDLDRFKLINDTFGHGTGDAVLCKVAERLAGAVRSCDRVARMGGDEFILLVDELASPEAASDVANRVLQALAMPVSLGGHEHELSGSIGIALYPRDGEDSETLIKHADNAMYRAKQSGRNGCAFFNEADTVHSTERFAMQAQLRRALQKREFVLHYQPRVDMRSGHVRGLEALVRWQHPERGLVMPGHFIDVAEESGLIVALGREVMEMAFADVPRLLAASGGRVTTAINLSAMQIAHEGFVDDVRELVTRTGVDPRTVEFEITETMLMRQPEQARQVIETLRQMGFSFSLDDFGTGYSSLTYLKRFPVQCVKIDRSFVKDIPGDASDLAITRAIIAMAHSLSLHVVAEGVETSEQLEALRRMNCDQYQGYFFSKPVPIDQVVALMNIDGAPDPALFTQALVLPKPKRLAAIPAG